LNILKRSSDQIHNHHSRMSSPFLLLQMKKMELCKTHHLVKRAQKI
jgi:hypothetical protein